jgi:hypothetical protein
MFPRRVYAHEVAIAILAGAATQLGGDGRGPLQAAGLFASFAWPK